jgi:hypothetical protein
VAAQNNIPYEIVIRTIDYCVNAGFPTVSVAPAEELK